MCDKLKTYTNTFFRYTEPQNVESNCNGISFYNSGNSTLYVNDMPVNPGSTFSINGNRCEIDKSSYKIAFRGVAPNECFVIKKNYQQ